MLLSIDRILQLLAEGKTIDKIAELAGCTSRDVSEIIEEIRILINKYEKPFSKKKIIIKKNNSPLNSGEGNNRVQLTRKESDDLSLMLDGAELSAVPFDSSLTIYTDGASMGNPGNCGIGIVIFDSEDRQVGKVSAYIGRGTNDFAEYTALIRALKIAGSVKTKSLKIRTDSELIVKQIKGEQHIKQPAIKRLHDQAMKLIQEFESCKIEHVSRMFNEKADYLSKRGADATLRKNS
jgi:ribonuclease HI